MKTSALSALARRTQEPPISWLMATALARPNLISLAAGFTDNASLPVHETRDSMNDLLRSAKTGQPALQYGSTAGDPQLRELTAAHLQRLDLGRQPAVLPQAYSADRVLITSGSQQLLYLTSEALCDAGDIVLVEDPTYFVFLGIVQSHGLRARGVRMESDGIDLAHLESVLESVKRRGELRRVKLLYLVTYFQNPTGITTSHAKKIAALKLLKRYERAAGHPIYLLEDAAYRELSFDDRAGLPGCRAEGQLHAAKSEKSAMTVRGAADRVIYAGTYSKPFATGLRVGFGLLPEPVLSAVRRIKGNHDFGTANLLQRTLYRAVATGRYDRHLVELQKRYARKAAVMRVVLVKHFPAQVKWDEVQGGLYYWARLPCGISTGVKSRLLKAALKADVLYVPGELCYAEDPTRRIPDNEMRLSFGSASEAKIREGIRRLGKVLQKFVRS